jgi:hypothetical protein
LSITGDGEATPAAADGEGTTEAAGEAAGLTAAAAEGDAAACGDDTTGACVGFAAGAGALVGVEGAAELQPAMISMAATRSLEVCGTFQPPREWRHSTPANMHLKYVSAATGRSAEVRPAQSLATLTEIEPEAQ